jgi:hypothetical protein
VIDLETIEREISELETRDTSYRLCERLSWLYTVRDHLKPQAKQDSALVPQMQGSDFLKAASGTRCTDLLKVIDEHLETIKLLYPKTYDSLLERVRSLH